MSDKRAASSAPTPPRRSSSSASCIIFTVRALFFSLPNTRRSGATDAIAFHISRTRSARPALLKERPPKRRFTRFARRVKLTTSSTSALSGGTDFARRVSHITACCSGTIRHTRCGAISESASRDAVSLSFEASIARAQDSDIIFRMRPFFSALSGPQKSFIICFLLRNPCRTRCGYSLSSLRAFSTKTSIFRILRRSSRRSVLHRPCRAVLR